MYECYCCSSCLDCCCCECCNYSFCGWPKCFSCCACSVININNELNNKNEKVDKDTQKNNLIGEYKEKMNDLRNDEKDLQDLLDDLRTDYIKLNNLDNYKCIWGKECFCFYLIFLLLSLGHFILIAEIQSIIFSLEKEIYKTIYFDICGNYTGKEIKNHYCGKYNETDFKNFDDYLKISSKHDSSQINFNYLSSFITDLFVSKTNIFIAYFISVLGIILVLLCVRFFNFLPLEKIINDKSYSGLGTIGLFFF